MNIYMITNIQLYETIFKYNIMLSTLYGSQPCYDEEACVVTQ